MLSCEEILNQELEIAWNASWPEKEGARPFNREVALVCAVLTTLKSAAALGESLEGAIRITEITFGVQADPEAMRTAWLVTQLRKHRRATWNRPEEDEFERALVELERVLAYREAFFERAHPMTEKTDDSKTDACDLAFAAIEYPVDGREIGDTWYHRQGFVHGVAVAAAQIQELTQALAEHRSSLLSLAQSSQQNLDRLLESLKKP